MTVKVCYWDTTSKSQKERDATPEEVAEITARQIASDPNAVYTAENIANLWTAADKYIWTYINGVGLSILAAGVYEGKPKAKAVAAWCDSIWAEYYVRRAHALVGGFPSLDFSGFGEIPHTVLELREEVEGLWGGE